MEEVMRFTILILVIVLSGHTVMVGNLGRTELATSAEEDAREFFRSAQALKALRTTSRFCRAPTRGRSAGIA